MTDRPGRTRNDSQLIAGARRFADRAFGCHERRDWEGFVVSAATSVELLAKAVLARVNVLLIADEKHDKNLLALALSDLRNGLPSEARTITAAKALERAEALGVRFHRYGADLKALREARNSVVHSGNFDHTKVGDREFDAWVRSMAALCDSEHGGYGRQDVFGDHADLVDLQMREYASALELLWMQCCTYAQQRWDQQKPSLTDAAYNLKRLRIEAELVEANFSDPTVQWAPCPVCGLPARLYGDLELEPHFETHYEPYDGLYTGDIHGSWEEFVGMEYGFVPLGLYCRTCQLRLDSGALVEEAGVLGNWNLDHDDVARWEEILEIEGRLDWSPD